MHNCKATKEAILDLVFNEANPDQRAGLKADLNQCAVCRSEYASFTATLDTINGSLESAKPAADFWSAYNARMGARLSTPVQNSALSSAAASQGFIHRPGRHFFSSIRVPLPIAAIFLLMLGVLTVVAIRSRNPIVANPTIQQVVETRNVEVPVIQERLITRVVYVNRNQGGARGRKLRPQPTKYEERGVPQDTAERSGSRLAGFRPIDQMKLTVIKGSDTNER